MYAGGPAPSFDPAGVIDALKQAIENPHLDHAELAAVVGPPSFPTRCSVAGELAALRQGHHATLRLSAQVRSEPASGTLVLTNLPLGVGNNDIVEAVEHRAHPPVDADDYPELAVATTLPIVSVNDEPTQAGTRIVCTLRPDSDPRDATAQLLDVWPVLIEHSARLRAPLGRLIRRTVDHDRTAQIDALHRLHTAIMDQRTSAQ